MRRDPDQGIPGESLQAADLSKTTFEPDPGKKPRMTHTDGTPGLGFARPPGIPPAVRQLQFALNPGADLEKA